MKGPRKLEEEPLAKPYVYTIMTRSHAHLASIVALCVWKGRNGDPQNKSGLFLPTNTPNNNSSLASNELNDRASYLCLFITTTISPSQHQHHHLLLLLLLRNHPQPHPFFSHPLPSSPHTHTPQFFIKNIQRFSLVSFHSFLPSSFPCVLHTSKLLLLWLYCWPPAHNTKRTHTRATSIHNDHSLTSHSIFSHTHPHTHTASTPTALCFKSSLDDEEKEQGTGPNKGRRQAHK